MSNNKFGVKEVFDVTFYDTVTNKPVMFFDTLKMSSIENTASQSFARGGKGNPKLLEWDFDRESTMKLQDALLSPRSFELLSGNAVTVGNATITMRQDTVWEEDALEPTKMVNKGDLYPLKADETGKISLAYTPLESASNVLVYDADDDGGTPLTAGTLSGKDLTQVAWANKEVVAYYTYTASNAQKYIITADKFPSTYKIVGDTVVRDAVSGKDVGFQVVINKAKLKPAFTMDFRSDGDPSVFDFEIDILRESTNPTMITMIQYNN